MKTQILMLVLSCVFIVSSVAMARSIPGAPNEVLDPWFQNITQDWYVEGQTWTLWDNPGNFPGNYFDPGRNPGDNAFLRTIVDDYDGLWNPDYNMKEIDFSMYAHIVIGGYVKVRFDWWYDEAMPKPSNDPNDPTTPAPDGYSQWYIADAMGNLPGDFTNRPDLILPGEEPGWFLPDGGESFLLNCHQIWDFQPRWVSIEIEAGVCPTSEFGGEALITGIDFEAQCIPEPTTMGMIVISGLMMIRCRRK